MMGKDRLLTLNRPTLDKPLGSDPGLGIFKAHTQDRDCLRNAN